MASYRKFLFFVFIFFIYSNKWIHVESTDSSTTPKSGTDGAQTNEKTTDVDIDKPMEPNYKSSQQGNYTLSFEPIGDYCFKAVKKGSTEIWATSKKEEYSKKVLADFAKHVVTIHIGSDGATKKVYKKGTDNKWQEDTNASTHKSTTPTPGGKTNGSGTKTGVELSLKATAESNEFEYKKDNKIVTYTAKDKYGFKSVKTGNTVVWSTDNASEYATKVVLNGKGKKKKTVIIYMPNGTKKVYNRENKGKPWNEVSQHAKTASTTPTSASTPLSGRSTQDNQADSGSATRTGTQSSGGPTHTK